MLNKDLKIKPNLENYEEAYRNFNWQDYHDELEWWVPGKLNAAHNAVDRHANSFRKNKVALYWVGPNDERQKYTFLELSRLSNKFANVLKKHGVQKGDRVFLFLPRVPETYISFLGILKTGAIAGTLFSAFGPDALKDRLQDSGAKYVVTNSELKERVYKIIGELPELQKLIVIDTNQPGEREISFWNEMSEASDKFECERTEPEDYAFMLYTSGTTGKPKGVMHAHYAVLQQHMTAKWVLNIHEEDTYWCTADPGWVTGIAYGILGVWSNGASQVVYAGRFNPEKWYSILEEFKVNIWYTAPTAIRMLQRKGGTELVKKYDLSNLRDMYSVGEPLNPEAIMWGKEAFGLVFHDNWWQTECGAMMITNYQCLPVKVGSMGKPFPGITASIVDDNGNELPPREHGNLAIRAPWPSMMRAYWNKEEKYKKSFVNGWYISGDKAWKDEDGYFWFEGRADDVIKTSGERVGPFEVESALVEHPAIAEAGVIGKPDPERGEIIKAFVTLNEGYEPSDQLVEEIKQFVKKQMAGHAYPREIEFRDSLPKTRSGKIMRRVLKAQELGQDIGDTSTMEEY
ncbi:acetate--CoA ligase [Candidatus Woesearchaeota archaeon]|nr:MAG: acetate--CoA ligase [Candidatus Woesearchaeota archaeon]